jgi:hypothetical protein
LCFNTKYNINIAPPLIGIGAGNVVKCNGLYNICLWYYFIETATSRLAAVIENSDKVEGYSFAIFHNFLFMDWAGKNIHDFTMVLAVLTVLVVSVLGLILFLKKK